jgi:hypothetical protein
MSQEASGWLDLVVVSARQEASNVMVLELGHLDG